MNSSDNEEETKYCFNCRRNIPLVNHVMHTAYCHRNLKLCLKCDEPFLFAEFEEHQKTMHVNILCDACSESLEAIDLESHKLNNCSHRLQTCNYCDIDVDAMTMPVHVDKCSSRTERCNDCGLFVMLKYLVPHRESHLLGNIRNVANPILNDSPESLEAYPPLIKKVPNTVSGTARTMSMPTLRIRDPIMTNHRASPPAKRNNDQPQINTLNNNDTTNKDQKKDIPIVDLLSDDDEFPIPGAHYIHNNQSENINNSLKNEYNNFSDVLKGVQLPCEFCEKMIDSENLVLHETGCRPDLAVFHNALHTNNKKTNKQNFKFPVPPLDLDSSSSSDSEINLNTLSLSSDDDDDDNDDIAKTNIEKLPCEFCDQLISIKRFINHQIKCEKSIHLELPKMNNLNEDHMYQSNGLDTKFLPKLNNTHETNLFIPKPAKANVSGIMMRKPVRKSQLPTSSTYGLPMTHRLPRAKLTIQNKQNSNKSIDNHNMNISARNNYEQFLSDSRLNHSEPGTARENTNSCFNPSGGAIPKQRNIKTNNNRRVLNDLSKQQRYSDESSD